MTNDDVQRLADELITLDPVMDSAYALSIRTNIIEYIYGFVGARDYLEYVVFDKKNLVQTHEDFIYFRFVKKCIATDVFYNTIMELLTWSKKKNAWGYRPVRAGKDGRVPFLGALYFLLSKRGFYKHELGQLQDGRISNSLEKIREELRNAGDIADGYSDEDFDDYREDTTLNADSGGIDEIFEDPTSEFDLFLRLAPLIAKRRQIEQHLGKSKRCYMDGFYTFDAVARTKEGLFDGNDVIEANTDLFPAMEGGVVTYLLCGPFASTRDIVENPAQDPQRLNQKNKTVQVCYGISGPTVSTKRELYEQLYITVIHA